MADQGEVDLDSIIDRLLEVRGSRPGKQVQLLEAEIRFLCTKAREIFISQPILLELEAPIKVRGAFHGGIPLPPNHPPPPPPLPLIFVLDRSLNNRLAVPKDMRRHSRAVL